MWNHYFQFNTIKLQFQDRNLFKFNVTIIKSESFNKIWRIIHTFFKCSTDQTQKFIFISKLKFYIFRYKFYLACSNRNIGSKNYNFIRIFFCTINRMLYINTHCIRLLRTHSHVYESSLSTHGIKQNWVWWRDVTTIFYIFN